MSETDTPAPRKFRSKGLESFFVRRGIRIPQHAPAWILAKARLIILKIERGVSFQALKGKRMSYDRNVVSIPIGRSWRLLAICKEDACLPQRLLTHQDYNHRRPGVR